jgi:hypothetical protein
MTPTSKLVVLVLMSTIAIVLLLLCIAFVLWKHHTTHGSCARDFERLSEEATVLSAETERIRRQVSESNTTDRTVRIANLALLAEADEWDTSIRICLTTWEDILSPKSGVSDEESGKRDAFEKGRKEDRGKYMISMMHAGCKEGLARRKELGPQLQRIHLSTLVR